MTKYLFRTWSLLQCVDERAIMNLGAAISRRLHTVFGQHNNMINDAYVMDGVLYNVFFPLLSALCL
jgi:hypothetical protein